MNHTNFSTRFLNGLLFSVLFLQSFAVKAQQFITKWSYPTGTTEIKFNALSAGGPVNYTWAASPSGNSGNGNFTMAAPGAVTLTGLNVPAGNTVTLRMEPANLRRFFIAAGPHHSNLMELSQWGTVPWSSMNSAFQFCENFTITAPDVPNLSNVTDMFAMFMSATNFNQPIGNWNTANVTNMTAMFYLATSFNQALNNWNTANVNNMLGMFQSARNFNQPIGNWNTVNVTNMSYMFSFAENFNQDIGNWNTANVTDMSLMFDGATNFNQPIGNWNTANVTDMSNMFNEATNFNQPIGNWDTGNVTNMQGMFWTAEKFNQPIGNWNTVKVTNMATMFTAAASFNQNIGSWALNSINASGLQFMLSFSGMDCQKYSETLNGWRAHNPFVMGLTLGAHGRQFGTNAGLARHGLINGQGWTIMGDSYSGYYCYEIEEECDCPVELSAPQTGNPSIEGGHEPVVFENKPAARSFVEPGSSQQQFQVYPNPLPKSTALHIVVSNTELTPEASLRILDLGGRVVHQQKFSNQTDLQLNHLPAGVYMLEATDAGARWHERIVLEQ